MINNIPGINGRTYQILSDNSSNSKMNFLTLRLIREHLKLKWSQFIITNRNDIIIIESVTLKKALSNKLILHSTNSYIEFTKEEFDKIESEIFEDLKKFKKKTDDNYFSGKIFKTNDILQTYCIEIEGKLYSPYLYYDRPIDLFHINIMEESAIHFTAGSTDQNKLHMYILDIGLCKNIKDLLEIIKVIIDLKLLQNNNTLSDQKKTSIKSILTKIKGNEVTKYRSLDRINENSVPFVFQKFFDKLDNPIYTKIQNNWIKNDNNYIDTTRLIELAISIPQALLYLSSRSDDSPLLNMNKSSTKSSRKMSTGSGTKSSKKMNID